MEQLPAARMENFVSPFSNTGIDYFGPINVTIGRRHENRWGVLFTFLSAGAVHVEVASSLSTDRCIVAIRHFTARHGNPINLYRDTGTNLVGANNQLKKYLQELNQKQLTTDCTCREIRWHFIPPHDPHMGGSWERLVTSVKTALNDVLKERHRKEDVLRTLLTETEHIVNLYPLTLVPMDPDDPEALTPNHFLIGRSSNDQVPGLFVEGDLNLLKQ